MNDVSTKEGCVEFHWQMKKARCVLVVIGVVVFVRSVAVVSV